MQILYSIITALCLCIGFYFGFRLGRTNELPKLIRTKEQLKKEKQEEKEISRLERELKNLNNYTGTSKGQEDII